LKISEMNDDEASATLLKAYRNACDVYDPDEHGQHPSHTVNEWIRASATGSTPGSTEKQIQSQDDDPQPEKSAGGNAGNGGAVPAQDGRYVIGQDGNRRFVPRGGPRLAGDREIEVRDNGPSTRASQRAMAAAFPGYDRLK